MDDPDPDALCLYLSALSAAWGLLFVLSGFLVIFVVLIWHAAVGNNGIRWLEIGFCPVLFCLAGELDATWRYALALRAKHLSSNEGSDSRSGLLVKIAQVNDGGVALQMVFGVVVTLIVLSR